MSEHDATSAAIAGPAGLVPPLPPLEPAALITAFCSATDKVGVYRGFCGFNGGKGDDLETGFDDGYAFLGYLESRGWSSLPTKGDWPLVVYLAWPPPTPEGSYAIAEYCEGDLTVWLFESREDAEAHIATLKDLP